MAITKASNSGLTGTKYDTISADNNGMEPISSVLVGSGGATSIVFSNIPQGYKHLQIRGIALNTGQDTLYISYNGDTTGANYRDHQVGGNGSTFAYSNAGVNGGGAGIGLASQTIGAGNIIDILDYSASTKNKTARCLWGVERNNAGSVGLFSNLWMSTSPITSITLMTFTYPFSQHSRFSLYGIKG